MKNIIVIGLGSMGRRRIRCLKAIFGNEINIIGIDANRERQNNVAAEYGIDSRDSLEAVLAKDKISAAFVSTSPVAHSGIISTCLEAGVHVFTEINLIDEGYEKNMSLAKDKGVVLFLSSTMLYRKEIEYIKNKVLLHSKCLNYSYHVGQYLPDWHPWESIQNYFVGDKRTNGCRELFAIELPWIIKTFGEIKSYRVISDRNTQLPIEYNDNYLLLIEHTNGNKGVLCVDVVSRKAVRNLEVYGENLYLTWDGTPLGLKEYDYENKVEKHINLYDSVDKQEGYASFVIENAYRNELETFINVVNGKESAEYTFEEDKQVLAMIDDIEAGNSK